MNLFSLDSHLCKDYTLKSVRFIVNTTFQVVSTFKAERWLMSSLSVRSNFSVKGERHHQNENFPSVCIQERDIREVHQDTVLAGEEDRWRHHQQLPARA